MSYSHKPTILGIAFAIISSGGGGWMRVRGMHEKNLKCPRDDKHIRQIKSNINNQCGLTLERTATLFFVYLTILFSLLATNSPENEESRRDNSI